MLVVYQLHRLIRSSEANPLQDVKSLLNVPPGHVVGIEIVVDMLMPLVRANHVIDLVIMMFGIVCCAACPEHRSTQHDLCSIIPHEFVIARHLPVLMNGVGNVCRDMQFDAPVGYRDEFFCFGMDDNWRRRFFAIQRTFPRVLRSFIAVSSCLFACGRKKTIAVEQ